MTLEAVHSRRSAKAFRITPRIKTSGESGSADRGEEHEKPLLWAETPGICAPRELYQYDLRNNSFSQIIIVDFQTWLLSWNLAISGDGRRVMHRQDVYEDGEYIGSISGLTDTLISPALTTAGDRALVLDPLTDVVALFVSTAGRISRRSATSRRCPTTSTAWRESHSCPMTALRSCSRSRSGRRVVARTGSSCACAIFPEAA